jgi:hypothetical protein
MYQLSATVQHLRLISLQYKPKQSSQIWTGFRVWVFRPLVIWEQAWHGSARNICCRPGIGAPALEPFDWRAMLSYGWPYARSNFRHPLSELIWRRSSERTNNLSPLINEVDENKRRRRAGYPLHPGLASAGDGAPSPSPARFRPSL